MEPRCNIWLEEDGALVMSDYRVRLLAAIHDTGSLAAAAQRMNLSYRRAWGKVRELEANMGRRLVDSAVGGAGGGGSRLTVDGLALVQRYQEFAEQARRSVAAIFNEIFTPTAPVTIPAIAESDRAGRS